MARGRAHDLRAGGSRRTMETFLQSSRTRAAVSLRRRVVLAGPVQLCGGGSCASRGGCAGQPALLLGARAAASATFVARSSSVRLASVSAEGGGADARLDGHDNLLSAMERDLLSNRFVDAAKKALFALKAGTDVEDERAKQILKGLVVSGKYGMAVRFFETHAGETSRLGYSSAHFAVVAYANLGRVGEVFKTIEDMREKGMRPNRATLTSAITALYKCSKQRRGLAAAHAAYRLWSEVQALEEGLDEGAARAGLLACVATGRMDEASSLAERWCRERPEWQSARTLNPVAQALARGGGGAGARRALAWMRGCGVEPDDATWNALVDAAVDGGGSGAAEEVLGMAEAAGARVGVWGWNALVKVRMAAGAAWLQRRRRAACEGRLRAGAGPGKRGASGRGPGCVGSDVGGRSGAQPRDIRHPNGGGSKGRGRGAVSGDLRGRGGQGCQFRGSRVERVDRGAGQGGGPGRGRRVPDAGSHGARGGAADGCDVQHPDGRVREGGGPRECRASLFDHGGGGDTAGRRVLCVPYARPRRRRRHGGGRGGPGAAEGEPGGSVGCSPALRAHRRVRVPAGGPGPSGGGAGRAAVPAQAGATGRTRARVLGAEGVWGADEGVPAGAGPGGRAQRGAADGRAGPGARHEGAGRAGGPLHPHGELAQGGGRGAGHGGRGAPDAGAGAAVSGATGAPGAGGARGARRPVPARPAHGGARGGAGQVLARPAQPVLLGHGVALTRWDGIYRACWSRGRPLNGVGNLPDIARHDTMRDPIRMFRSLCICIVRLLSHRRSEGAPRRCPAP